MPKELKESSTIKARSDSSERPRKVTSGLSFIAFPGEEERMSCWHLSRSRPSVIPSMEEERLKTGGIEVRRLELSLSPSDPLVTGCDHRCLMEGPEVHGAPTGRSVVYHQDMWHPARSPALRVSIPASLSFSFLPS